MKKYFSYSFYYLIIPFFAIYSSIAFWHDRSKRKSYVLKINDQIKDIPYYSLTIFERQALVKIYNSIFNHQDLLSDVDSSKIHSSMIHLKANWPALHESIVALSNARNKRLADTLITNRFQKKNEKL